VYLSKKANEREGGRTPGRGKREIYRLEKKERGKDRRETAESLIADCFDTKTLRHGVSCHGESYRCSDRNI